MALVALVKSEVVKHICSQNVDGLHLSGEGYNVWLKGLAKAFVGVSYPAWREEEDDDLDARVQPARIS